MAQVELYTTYHKCDILLLNNTILVCDYSSQEKGEDLLEKVCRFLKISEKGHFGLKFQDILGYDRWLHLQKLICPQVHCQKTKFLFEVRFYPMLPNDIPDPHTRQHIYLQLRKDFEQNKFLFPESMQIFLLAIILQHDFGTCYNGYSKHDLFLSKQTFVRNKARFLHQNKLKNIAELEAKECFLVTIGNMDTYGMDLFDIRDCANRSGYLGVNYQGVSIFHNKKLKEIIFWNDIEKFLCEGEVFIITLATRGPEGFHCGSKLKCFRIWKQVMDHLTHFCITEGTSAYSDISRVLVDVGSETHLSASTALTDTSLNGISRTIATFMWNLEQQVNKNTKATTCHSISHLKLNDLERETTDELVGHNFVYISLLIFILIFVVKGHFKLILSNLLWRYLDTHHYELIS